MTVATYKATGTSGNGYCREGRVRFAFTLDEALFAALKASALKNQRTVAEEIRLRLATTERAA